MVKVDFIAKVDWVSSYYPTLARVIHTINEKVFHFCNNKSTSTVNKAVVDKPSIIWWNLKFCSLLRKKRQKRKKRSLFKNNLI